MELGHEVRIYTSGLDDRYGIGKVTSRIGLEKPAAIISPGDNEVLHELFKELLYANGPHKIKAVFVDECQFLDKEQIDLLSDLVDNHDVSVFCYGIRTDFESKLFSGSSRLFEIADKIEELPNICECGRKSIMNARLVNSTAKVLIGGNDTYKSMCRKCFKLHQKGK
ncbi:thymidine kinase [Xanthomonas phage XaC1]|nr:thymidine kinase [Xanthomonas phage XaC1]